MVTGYFRNGVEVEITDIFLLGLEFSERRGPAGGGEGTSLVFSPFDRIDVGVVGLVPTGVFE